MNLDNLRPAWNQLKLQHSMDDCDQEGVLAIIESNEQLFKSKALRLVGNYAMFLFIMLCCGGG